MSIWGISMVKDEIDIVEHTVRHMIEQCDHVVVIDNNSTDGTRELLNGMEGGSLTVGYDEDPAFFQSAKLTALAIAAADRGADWVVPFDADEIWYTTSGKRIRDDLSRVSRDIATCEYFEHPPVLGSEPDPIKRMMWREEKSHLLKVAARTRPGIHLHEGAHSVDYSGVYPLPAPGLLLMRHFPYRTLEQFEKKVRSLYEGRMMTDPEEDQSIHVRHYGSMLEKLGTPWLERVWAQKVVLDPDKVLTHDPAPSRAS